jgi:hypothetical protein
MDAVEVGEDLGLRYIDEPQAGGIQLLSHIGESADKAHWDGTTESSTIGSFWNLFVTHSGKLPALSLVVRLSRPSGELLYAQRPHHANIGPEQGVHSVLGVQLRAASLHEGLPLRFVVRGA